MVFSTGGDLILICSKTLTDTTSIGSILAAMNTATTGLNALLKTKVSLIRFGESDKELWMLPYQNQWIIAGAHVPLKQALLKPLMSHLKIASRSAKAGRETEALEGMNETTIDTAIAQVIDR